MEGRSKGETVEEMLEAIDISGCMNGNYDAIVLSRLLNVLQMHFNIPLESNPGNIQIGRYPTTCPRAASSSPAVFTLWGRTWLLS